MAKMPTYEELLKAERSTLIQLQGDLDRALKDSLAVARKAAKEELEARATELGFSAADLFGIGTGSKQKDVKKTSEPKYAHPENMNKTWTGRGRQPDWVKSYLAEGKSLEELLIS
ncbi:H-NS histone family protein [Cereibacter sp. SYSU M97828]|nr:H-NS histone family protein [Cereibacter flavus]